MTWGPKYEEEKKVIAKEQEVKKNIQMAKCLPAVIASRGEQQPRDSGFQLSAAILYS